MFNNFYVGESGFTIDDTPYWCVEQFYQKSKAVFSGDLDTAAEIIMESDPAQMKQLGDTIKLNAGQWKRFKSLDVMEKAVWEEFHQNPTLMKHLVETKKLPLVECNKYDNFWGIGLTLKDKLADDEKSWKGKNKFGSILTKVRDSQ